jgi:radical SAM superfamily enzyme YgiQ (UPF0313 family)
MKVLLVNSNLMRPPVSPVALDILAEELQGAGFTPVILDLAWSENVQADIDATLGDDYLFAAVSVRNTDTSFFPGSDACLRTHRQVVARLRAAGLKVAVGGVGFSIVPEAARDFLGADFPVAGDAEEAVVALARALARREHLEVVPGLVGRNPPAQVDLSRRPPLSRRFVDNAHYLREGGQVGFETKRGCPHGCIACADPVAKGKTVRTRDPVAVAAEVRSLLVQGVDVLHTCDSEFNVPRQHADAVCQELIRVGLGDRLRWYAYCTPAGFDRELALLMRRAGCVGVDFSADHGDPAMLARLRCPHTVEDLRRTAQACPQAGLRFMFDLLLGGPGETRASILTTVELMRELLPTRVGVSLGVRLYRGCPIVDEVDLNGENPSIHTKRLDPTLLQPTYYLENSLGEDVGEWLEDVIGGDPRFFFAAASHNYDGNERVSQLIRTGARGAYWDILARAAGD